MENPLLKAYHFTFEMRRVWSDQPEQGIPIIKVWDARRRDFTLKREDLFQRGGRLLLIERVFFERSKARPLPRKRPQRVSGCIPAISALLMWLAWHLHNDGLCVNCAQQYER